MTSAAISINPAKFSIYDVDLPSEASDSEIDSDEWVSVSSSSTTSTISTLPSHLNLKPKLQSNASKVRSSSRSGREGAANAAPSSPPPSPQATATAMPASILPSAKSTSPYHHPKVKPARLPAISTLKTYFPDLTAIYIVSPKSMYSAYQTQAETQHARIYKPLASLTTVSPHPPISTSASTKRGTDKETYIRVCSDCAKPSMTIYCDGTWTTSSGGICSEHSAAMLRARRSAGPHRPGEHGKTGATTAETSGSRVVCTHTSDTTGCKTCDDDRDGSLFGDALQAVAPFNRAETARMGVAVFDMTVPVATEVYKHVSGCACAQW